MKYFRELSKDDKERALFKLINKPQLKFNTLLRVLCFKPTLEGEVAMSPASVVKFYFDKDGYLRADCIFDDELDTVYALGVEYFEKCDTRLNSSRTMEEQHKAREALVQLLNSGDHYMFDSKNNAYPV